jgi:type II secretory pathway pseudopilin PulG
MKRKGFSLIELLVVIANYSCTGFTATSSSSASQRGGTTNTV